MNIQSSNDAPQLSLSETDATRTLLDKLLSDSKLYTKGKDYQELLDFVVHLRNFAPFNAMLLQIQKPGLAYAASADDWLERFGRRPKEGARPLLILWPFGPVALVYDEVDTEGAPLPEDVASFVVRGEIDESFIRASIPLVQKKNIGWLYADSGDLKAGSIRVIERATKKEETTLYQMVVNKNHSPAVQFATLVHELGHLFLGHLGYDRHLGIPDRRSVGPKQGEIEAESVAYIVCKRNGVSPKSETYLSAYVDKNTTIDQIDIYKVMRAAGQVETLLKLTEHTKFEKPT